ncbi:MAG: hypothetical protein QNK04_09920 [Myxococcota bacterium]|nr:hypothetical protein [Myxococcota bacterium]
MASLYDCYTITVLLTIEDAGSCRKDEDVTLVHFRPVTAPKAPGVG